MNSRIARDRPFWNALGAAVRKRRRELGLSQDKAAEPVGLDRRALARIEQGARTLDLRETVLLARVLKLSPGELVPQGRA